MIPFNVATSGFHMISNGLGHDVQRLPLRLELNLVIHSRLSLASGSTYYLNGFNCFISVSPLLALTASRFSLGAPFSLVWSVYFGYWQAWAQRGWILTKFFFFACLWTETESRSINLQKRTRPIYIQPS